MNDLHILCNLSEQFKNDIEFLNIFNEQNANTKVWKMKRNVLLITKNDDFYAFGENSSGVLGLGHNKVVTIPVKVEQLCHKGIVYFDIGWSHSMALSFDGKVYCFGSNKNGELGNGVKDNKYHMPELVKTLSDMNVKDISCGNGYSVVLTNGGDVYTWGYNYFDQMGNEKETLEKLKPSKVSAFGGEKIVMVSNGFGHSLALTESGNVFGWGLNDCGQLGYLNKEFLARPQLVPVKDESMNNIMVKKISCGFKHSLLLTENGDIYAFGSNNLGQLGNSNQKNLNTPTKINNKIKYIDIATNKSSKKSLAFSTNGVYYLWGYYVREVIKAIKIDHKTLDDFFLLSLGNSLISSNENNFLPIMRYSKYKQEFIQISMISSGSYGIVFKALNKKDKKIYAIKLIPLNKNEIKASRELEVMSKLKSNFIVECKMSWLEANKLNFDELSLNIHLNHPVFNSNNKYLLFFQMEYCLKSLKEIILQMNNEMDSKPNQLSLEIMYFIGTELLVEILESVEFLHDHNVIHRDLKPENILITDGKNGRFVKIADFGLAVIHDFVDQSHSEDRGTVKYMAPEVIKGTKYNLKADIYSLGVIINELFNFDSVLIEKSNIAEKYRNLIDIKENMLSENFKFRYDCIKILNAKPFWTLSLYELINNFRIENILKSNTKSIDESFHEYFIKEKVRTFFEAINLIRKSVNSNINLSLSELSAMYHKIDFCISNNAAK
jgi:alpha-tubulin suppressor-like RCC1 family protein/serine/threonine protein kinase